MMESPAGNLGERDLVAEWNRILGADGDRCVAVHQPAAQLLRRLDALHDRHSDGILFVVNQIVCCHGCRFLSSYPFSAPLVSPFTMRS